MIKIKENKSIVKEGFVRRIGDEYEENIYIL